MYLSPPWGYPEPPAESQQTPGSTYLWNDNSTDPVFTVFSPGIFWVEITNPGGCTDTDSINIHYKMLPDVNLGNDTVFCQGSWVLDATVPGGTDYLWQDGSVNTLFTVTSPGIYWVEITNSCGSKKDSIVIKKKYLETDFGYEEIPCTNQIQFINLSSDTSLSYWDLGDGTTSNENNPLHIYGVNEKYTVLLITNPNSACADTAQAVIPFENDVSTDTLFIPNVFTPNGDGKNDFFEINETANPCISFSKLTIFNRWGMKVFETEGSQLQWDGTKNENALTDGVYFYVLEGEGFKKSGCVTLLR